MRGFLERRRALKVSLLALMVIVFVGVGLSVFAYVKANQKIDSQDFTGLMVNPRPAVALSDKDDPYDGRALNYVIIGSDSRAGDNADVDSSDISGMRSDTTVVAHVSADRERVDMVSIPRDSIVKIPSCKLSSGVVTQERVNGMFNAAFALGDDLVSSVACTVATVEANTGVFIDGYVVIDFSSFEKVVDSLGGVEFNVPYDMVAKKADLDLKKGEQVLNGHDALAFARARTFEVGGGDGSDISRISRQQDLMKAIASQLLSSDTLSNPVKTFNTVGSVLESLTVSPDLGSVNKLAGFAYGVRGVKSEAINFATIPHEPWAENRNRVIWSSDAVSVWDALKNDKSMTVK